MDKITFEELEAENKKLKKERADWLAAKRRAYDDILDALKSGSDALKRLVDE